MKILRWVSNNILFLITLFLLAFIPLYPKLPLLDIKNTWVYIRVEDFVVVFVLLVWMALLFLKKVTLRTPLTLPIMIFWIIGALATIHGVLLIFPSIANVFPNVAFLSFVRRIEYLSLFFIAYSAMKDKRFFPYIIAVLVITFFLVFAYGVGQKYFGFPAYLTMNEEFAKGIPIRLSELSRVPSTFGGHYDVAAYLVLIIPIFVSLIFAFRSLLLKILLLISVCAGFVLLFMTVSRVSFFVLLVALIMVLFFQKKRFVFYFLPIVSIIIVFLFVSFSTTLLERFGSSIKEVDVLIEAKTGQVIGHVQTVPSIKFKDKTIKQKLFQSKDDLSLTKKIEPKIATPSALLFPNLPYSMLPPEVILLVPQNLPTGESLPQGTGYINLPLAPVKQRAGEFFFERTQPQQQEDLISTEVTVYHGDFLIKRASAYDLSFTTRFQGEWPNAIKAFKENIFFGSGYSSVSLAVDNNYLRILGEIGLLGFASFFGIFLTSIIYIKKVLPDVDSPVVRCFVLGFVAGVAGLALNAVFIDVFEASKIAYILWLLTGVSLGMLSLYQKNPIHLYQEFKKAVTSTYAVIVYLIIVSVVVFSAMISNSFVGDDFTWFRWIADCNSGGLNSNRCPTAIEAVFKYFTESNGFFYRPGTKTYFLIMYSVFWLNQAVYHSVSILLHFIVAVLVFLLAKKVLRDYLFSVLAAFLFLILSGYSEAVFWVSSTGFLFNAVFVLSSLLFYIKWEEERKNYYFVASLVSLIFALFFHELGVVTPLFIILYELLRSKDMKYPSESSFAYSTQNKLSTTESFALRDILKKSIYVMFLPIIPYLIVRYIAQSHWFSGDYSYNLLKLPFNVVGNATGYFFLDVLGTASLPLYNVLRTVLREYIVFSFILTLVMIVVLSLLYRFVFKMMNENDKRIVLFGFLFFVIALLPFLGLGNISPRYSYLSSVGFILLFSFIIKKLYNYLLYNGREIALATTTVVIMVFSLLHFIQIQQIHGDWHEAGERVKRFFVAMDSLYSDYWAYDTLRFYFVNVPLRTGEAWIFPVGLSDAIWFRYRNPNIYVYQPQSVEQALDAVDGLDKEKVFVFDDKGRITERKKVLIVK